MSLSLPTDPNLLLSALPVTTAWLPWLQGLTRPFSNAWGSPDQARYSAPLSYGFRVSPHLLGDASQWFQVPSFRGQVCVFWDSVDQELAGLWFTRPRCPHIPTVGTV